jgi:DNA-binding transcriptional MocR family regulator
MPVQNGIAQMLRQEAYETHLTKLRQALATQQEELARLVRAVAR